MKGHTNRILRTIGGILLLCLLVLAALGIATCLKSQQQIATQACSLGPTVSQLERFGELASARIHVTDILMADGEGFPGAWLIKGDALLTCDVSCAKTLNLDPTTRTATLRLPSLRVTSARVDHTKTKTWSVEKKSWLPWTGGNQSVFRDAAMHHLYSVVWLGGIYLLGQVDGIDAATARFLRFWHLVDADHERATSLFQSHVFALHPATGLFVLTSQGRSLLGNWLTNPDSEVAFERLPHGFPFGRSSCR